MSVQNFVTRPVRVEALFFDGNNHAELKSFYQEVQLDSIDEDGCPYPLKYPRVATDYGLIRIDSNTWIVKMADGFGLFSTAEFEMMYMPA